MLPLHSTMMLLLMPREDVDGTPALALVLVRLMSFQTVASSHHLHHRRRHLVHKDRKGKEPHPYPIALDLALVLMTLNHLALVLMSPTLALVLMTQNLALVRAGSAWRGGGSRGLLRRAAW